MSLCEKDYICLPFLILALMGIIWINILLSELFEFKECKTVVNNLPEDQIKFNTYLTRFNKSYFGDEYVKRFGYFKKSLEEIAFLNSKNGTGAVHGLTKFSDLSQAEFAKLMHNPGYGADCWESTKDCRNLPPYISLKRKGLEDFYDMIYSRFVRDSWDWRTDYVINDKVIDVVGPVLNQKLCLGCWAFGVVGVMESMEVIQGKRPYTQRSIQELIDCSTYDEGCKGGHVSKALDFLCFNNMSIITVDEYPLKLMQDSCNLALIDKFKTDGRGVSQYWTKCNVNENLIISKIYHHGPVIAVVNPAPWRHYIGGIIHRACYRSLDENSVDHVVQIVGYNLKSEIPYYIIKNSWGEDFGENGYVKVAIGGNVCGIADEITYLYVK